MARIVRMATLCILVSALSLSVAARSTTTRKSNGGQKQSFDQTFVQKAAAGGLAEVQLGQTAQSQGASEAVRQFGQRMVQDHSTANEKLTDVAQQAELAVPLTLDAKHQQMAEELSAETGAAFDRMYAASMVKDHRDTIALFEQAASDADDPALRQFAQKTLPTLREHLQLAQQMQRSVGAGGTYTARYTAQYESQAPGAQAAETDEGTAGAGAAVYETPADTTPAMYTGPTGTERPAWGRAAAPQGGGTSRAGTQQFHPFYGSFYQGGYGSQPCYGGSYFYGATPGNYCTSNYCTMPSYCGSPYYTYSGNYCSQPYYGSGWGCGSNCGSGCYWYW